MFDYLECFVYLNISKERPYDQTDKCATVRYDVLLKYLPPNGSVVGLESP